MTASRDWNYTWTDRTTANTREHTGPQPTHVDTQDHNQHKRTHRITANTRGQTGPQPTHTDTQDHNQHAWTHRITTKTRGHTGSQPTQVVRQDHIQHTWTYRIITYTCGHTVSQPIPVVRQEHSQHTWTQDHSQHTGGDVWLNVSVCSGPSTMTLKTSFIVWALHRYIFRKWVRPVFSKRLTKGMSRPQSASCFVQTVWPQEQYKHHKFCLLIVP